jgi:hypothetical protein
MDQGRKNGFSKMSVQARTMDRSIDRPTDRPRRRHAHEATPLPVVESIIQVSIPIPTSFSSAWSPTKIGWERYSCLLTLLGGTTTLDDDVGSSHQSGVGLEGKSVMVRDILFLFPPRVKIVVWVNRKTDRRTSGLQSGCCRAVRSFRQFELYAFWNW